MMKAAELVHDSVEKFKLKRDQAIESFHEEIAPKLDEKMKQMKKNLEEDIENFKEKAKKFDQ